MDWNKITASYKKNYLPSKKIQLIILVLIIGGISFWVVPYIREYYQGHRVNFSLTGKPPEPIIITEANPTGTDRDTDGDGVPDWQEALFGFDPTNKDTDGDGAIDSLPTVDGKSLGDFITTSTADKIMISVYEKFKNTPTDSISSEEVSAVISEEVLAHANSIESSFKKYTSLDIELIDSEKNQIISYQTAIDTLATTMTDPVIFAKDIQSAILKKENPTKEISLLNSGITKLLSIPVPAKISDIHIGIINAVYSIKQTLELPSTDDELMIYTKSILVQKNINLLNRLLSDLGALAGIYATSN